MAAVVQLVERPVVVREVAGSIPVSRPVVSHGVGGRVQENPELGPFGPVRGFLLLSCGKVSVSTWLRYRLAPGLDDTAHLPTNRTVGAFAFGRATVRAHNPLRAPQD